MNRRTFLQLGGAALASSIYLPDVVWAGPKNPMKRIGLTTVTFRGRFRATRFKDLPVGRELTLRQVPEFFADRFKLHNLEFWSRHFESKSASYLKDLRKAVAKTRSTLINIQLDEPESLQMANADEAKRQKTLSCAKEWLDICTSVGSKAIRVNTGAGSMETCIRSFKEINQYAVKKGVTLLVENHGGLSSNPENLVRIIKEVGGDNIRSLPDFGNYPPDKRYGGLKKIMPHAYQISAKAMAFNEKMEHISYDLRRCMKIAKEGGFKGIYSIEQWEGKTRPLDYYEKVTDWMIEFIREHI